MFNKRPCASIDAEAGAAAPLSKKLLFFFEKEVETPTSISKICIWCLFKFYSKRYGLEVESIKSRPSPRPHYIMSPRLAVFDVIDAHHSTSCFHHPCSKNDALMRERHRTIHHCPI
jgi:hypothetical protein